MARKVDVGSSRMLAHGISMARRKLSEAEGHFLKLLSGCLMGALGLILDNVAGTALKSASEHRADRRCRSRQPCRAFSLSIAGEVAKRVAIAVFRFPLTPPFAFTIILGFTSGDQFAARNRRQLRQ